LPAKLDECVEKVKGQPRVTNPWAICRGQLGSDAKIRAGGKKKGTKKGRRY
jgi:hypothetical protein